MPDNVVSDLMSTPLDFSKPLWQCHYIEGVGSGSAILLRFHHCIGDGVALVHVILSLTDTAVDAPWPKRTKLMAHEEHVGERIVSLIDEARSAVERTVKTTRKVTGELLEEGVEALLHPSHVLDMAQTATEAAAVLVKLLLKSADSATHFKGRLGVAKRAAWSRLPPPHRAPSDIVTAFLAQRFRQTPLTLAFRAWLRLLDKAAEFGVTGGAVYDALIAATVRQAGATLLTRDQRAAAVYEKMGVAYELVF